MTYSWQKRAALAFAMLALCSMLLTGCGTDLYSSYREAFQKVTAAGGFDADLRLTAAMSGTTKNAEGNFKVDNSGSVTRLYLQAKIDNEFITQFTDGEYMYVDARGEKARVPLGVSRQESGEDRQENDVPPQYTTEDFLRDLASLLEAGKIRELQILNPIEQNYVSQITKNGNTYHLVFSSSALDKLSDSIASSIRVEGESVQLRDMENFTYDATQSGGYITEVSYSGTMTAVIPAAIAASGQEETYPLDLTISAVFNNPGTLPSFSLPSTAEYQ